MALMHVVGRKSLLRAGEDRSSSSLVQRASEALGTASMLQVSDRQSKAALEGSVENYLMKLLQCLGSCSANESQVIPHHVNDF